MFSKFILLVYLVIPYVYCAVSREEAPVKDEYYQQMGYACESSNSNLGFLRDGEVRKRYQHNICGQATCESGVILHETCGVAKMEGCRLVENSPRPYPDCCTHFKCD